VLSKLPSRKFLPSPSGVRHKFLLQVQKGNRSFDKKFLAAQKVYKTPPFDNSSKISLKIHDFGLFFAFLASSLKILCSYDTNMIKKKCDNILYRGRRDFEFVRLLEGRYQGETNTHGGYLHSFGGRLFIDHIKP
jgi:hypothetical protein